MAEKNRKFMQSFGAEVYRQLDAIANERGITVQELLRAVIVPEWLRAQDKQADREVVARAE